jgi:hypothetical protein
MRESSPINDQHAARDERADVNEAIADASSTDVDERRRASRIRRKVATQMVPWSLGQAPTPVQVVLEDISETGIGIVHFEPIEKGRKFLVTVPRPNARSTVVECITVRCEQFGQQLYKIGLAASSKIEDVDETRKSMMVTSKRTKVLFIVFGIVSLIIAAIWPL